MRMDLFHVRQRESLLQPLKWTAVGDVAQLEEHLLCMQGVVGSSPIVSTEGCKKNNIFPVRAPFEWAFRELVGIIGIMTFVRRY